MYELIYYSIASPSLNKKEIPQILKISQDNNSKKEITGCMLYHNDAFLQLLEGDRETVESLFAKIEQDERHYNVKLVFSDNKDERLFKDWTMAFFDLDKNDAVDKSKLILRDNFTAIANQTDHSTVASQLFWDISKQIISE